jgi:hypothetical protein
MLLMLVITVDIESAKQLLELTKRLRIHVCMYICVCMCVKAPRAHLVPENIYIHVHMRMCHTYISAHTKREIRFLLTFPGTTLAYFPGNHSCLPSGALAV